MAKVNYGGVVQDARGSQNGITYSRNGSGSYIRRKVTPVNPKSARQQAVRQAFGLLSKQWSGLLTQAQRQAWTAFAAVNPVTDIFGLSIILSGIATYIRLNQVLKNIGAATELMPPPSLAVPALATPLSMTATVAGGAITVTTGVQAAVANAEYYIFATPPLQPGINPNQNAYRFIGVVPSSASATTLLLGSLWGILFGTLIAGKNVWVAIAAVNTQTGAVTPAVKLVATAS